MLNAAFCAPVSQKIFIGLDLGRARKTPEQRHLAVDNPDLILIIFELIVPGTNVAGKNIQM